MSSQRDEDSGVHVTAWVASGTAVYIGECASKFGWAFIEVAINCESSAQGVACESQLLPMPDTVAYRNIEQDLGVKHEALMMFIDVQVESDCVLTEITLSTKNVIKLRW